MQNMERACRCIAGPPTSTGSVGNVQLVSTSRRHRHDGDHPQIPKNDKSASRQRQILLPSGSFTPFVFGIPTLGVTPMVGNQANNLRVRVKKTRATEEATVDWPDAQGAAGGGS